jgi:histidinol-phosphate aminotransferase
MPEHPLLIEPVPALKKLPPYSVGRPPFETDLILDFNESLEPLPISGPVPDAPDAHLYPWTETLEAQLAQRLEVEADRLIVTCGADDSLERSVRSVCCPGRRAVLMQPTYGMPRRYAITSGAEIVMVPWWEGSFPVDGVCDTCGDDTSLLYLVSPNNPSGSVITRDEFTTVVERLPQTLILHDQAYREFADPEFDLTEVALAHPNVVLVRTFSKAWGGAGLRIGYAVGDRRVVDWMRRIGQPFPVSRLSLAAMETTVANGGDPRPDRIQRVRDERKSLTELLTELGAEPLPSQASFVAARFTDAPWVRTAMASLGIAIRGFHDRSALNGWLRTTLPGNDEAFRRLSDGFRTVLRPEVVVFDVGGVSPQIESLPFEDKLTRELADRMPASRNGTTPTDAIGPILDSLADRPAWLVGTTPDTIRAARAAAVLPLGWALSAGEAAELMDAGAARIVGSLYEITELAGGAERRIRES